MEVTKEELYEMLYQPGNAPPAECGELSGIGILSMSIQKWAAAKRGEGGEDRPNQTICGLYEDLLQLKQATAKM